MSKRDWLRVAQHFPIGAVAAWATTVSIPIGLTIFWSTIAYEAMNDWRKKDNSYIDCLGLCWGFGITSIGLLIYN